MTDGAAAPESCKLERMAQVFVSYSSKDVDFVLEHLVPGLRAAGLEVWCSATHLREADNWERQIRAALARSDWFVVVLSPDAQRSPWVQAETHWALEHMAGRVVPVMRRSCHPAETHLLLGTVRCIDFRADPALGVRQLLAALDDDPRGKETAVMPKPRLDQLAATAPVARPRFAALTLHVLLPGGAGREQRLRIFNRAVLGRSPDTDLHIADASVSRRHARIDVAGSGANLSLSVLDLNSSNGTFVNGEPVHAPRPFVPRDIISVGDVDLRIIDIA
jgi:hypothetical protein